MVQGGVTVVRKSQRSKEARVEDETHTDEGKNTTELVQDKGVKDAVLANLKSSRRFNVQESITKGKNNKN